MKFVPIEVFTAVLYDQLVYLMCFDRLITFVVYEVINWIEGSVLSSLFSYEHVSSQ